jgi:[ribosomal protein S18]-alanine N-acetyltransferase
MVVKTSQAGGLLMERATAQDLDRILHIEQASFTVPWTRKMFEVEVTQNPFGHVYVARSPGDDNQESGFVGYVCFWVVFEEFRLMTLAVEPSARRRGFGRALLRHALALGRAQGATRALLEVRASNAVALQMYEQEGFQQAAVRTRYYANPVEDAMLMEQKLSADLV